VRLHDSTHPTADPGLARDVQRKPDLEPVPERGVREAVPVGMLRRGIEPGRLDPDADDALLSLDRPGRCHDPRSLLNKLQAGVGRVRPDEHELIGTVPAPGGKEGDASCALQRGKPNGKLKGPELDTPQLGPP